MEVCMKDVEKFKKLASDLDGWCNQALDLPAGTEIAPTGDEIEMYKLIISIQSGVLLRQLARAGIVPDGSGEEWTPTDQRLCDVRQALGK
jgi:hypothetical protein